MGETYLETKEYLGKISLPDIPEGVTVIKDRFMDGMPIGECPKLPSTLKVINNWFCRDTRITKPPVIPPSVILIGNSFMSGSKITEPPIIPDAVTEIGNHFLRVCRLLRKPPIIPNSVTRIGNNFLFMCKNLEEPPIIPNSVTVIGNNFLQGCTMLKRAPKIPYSVQRIGTNFMEWCDIDEPPFLPPNIIMDTIFLTNDSLEKTLDKWKVPWDPIEFENVQTFSMYWERKNRVRECVLASVLDLPLHILKDTILTKLLVFPLEKTKSLLGAIKGE